MATVAYQPAPVDVKRNGAAPAEMSAGWRATRRFVDAAGVLRRRHLHEMLVQRAVKRAAAEAGLTKRVMPLPAPLVRHALARVGCRHTNRSRAARSYRRADDDDLHARVEPGWSRRPQ